MISTLDLGFRTLPKAAAAFLLKIPGSHVLVECGPAVCHDRLAAELERNGSSLQQIKHLFLTHIHLDHAGGCGALARLGAEIHVHPRGAPHLIDPSRLNRSALRVFGPALERDLGPLEASPDQHVHPVEPGDSIEIGGAVFTAIETTGHASHHHSWLASIAGERHLFSGDAAGMRLPGTRFPTLPMVPPEFDLDRWLHSIRTLQSADADTMWMTHFDAIDDHEDFLEKTHQRMIEEVRLISSLSHELESDAIAEYATWHMKMAEDEGVPEGLLETYCDRTHYTANLTGVQRWREKGGRLP